ncbi:MULTISPECIES: transposase domain-containing protein [Marinomonas]|uniref:Mu transposase C-terminal domain-containing protein n=1 Tax=Marinomonas rhodophyticola TaxID=2992803 RepID=A0ABT3KCQ3_9GAMM|nr:transposase domain-containing protein [Marinomonas sp. KJ51-3]MCW4628249.1 Mu transposase C-terminal domain-containing protein [Marinomonas sp. KJ51-3]
MWLTATEIAGAAGMPATERNAREKLKQLAMSQPELARKREGTKAFEYHISILPAATQAALFKRAGQIKVGEKVFDVPQPKSDRYCREALWSRWNNAGSKAQAKAKAKLSYLTVLQQLVNSGVPKMTAYESVCEEYGVAFASVRREFASLKNFAEQDWLPVLLPKNKEAAVSARKARFAFITPAAWDFIKSDYLRQEEPTFSVCYERLKDAAKRNPDWVIPSKKSLERRMYFEVPQEHRTLLRKGEHALAMLYPPQERTVADLHAMEWINGDGYQHNVFVRWFNGEVIRPKTWFWQDIYSRKIVGWRCDVSENTDSIRLSMMDVCEKYGIPKEVTIDNTRAAANKWMTGGVPNRYRFKVKEDDPLGIIPMLGMKLHWSSVILGKGHGQAKPIERAFGVGGLEEYIDKHPSLAGAYTGPNPMAKPDNYGSKAIEADVFLAAIAKGVEMYNAKANRNTEMAHGFMSFNDVFNTSYQHAAIRKATTAQLQMMMLQAEAVTVDKHGTITLDAGGSIKGQKNRYYHQSMMDMVGKKLVARFDPLRLHDAVEIYTLDGVHICRAECQQKVGFGDTQAARETKRHRTQFTKATKVAAKAHQAMDALELAAQMSPLEEEIIPDTKVVMPFRPAVAYGNVAVAQQPQYDEETEYEQNFAASIADYREQLKKNKL